MQKKRIKELLKGKPNTEATVRGWVRTVRDQKSFAFIEVNDGSTISNLQVIADANIPRYAEILPQITTGASVVITGQLVASPGKNQSLELRAQEMRVLGTCDPAKYPLQKKRHTFEFLRTIAHLRPRTNTQGAVLRVRNALAFATHLFFQERGFLYVQTPIITGSDCEGGGEMFRVTTLEKPDPAQDFFGKSAYLTVSGQLEGEIVACALTDIYTFGPTFRAENSNTSRHLAEFWMIEPEMAFADLKDNMECAEAYLKYCIRYLLKHCPEDLQFFDQFIEKGLIARLQHVADTPFAHIPYTEAIALLKKSGKTFEFPVEWGIDLQSEHERYLAEEHCKKPVILTDYPAAIKAFYMRANSDGKTVAAMDVLVPKIGELIGGAQREERLDYLEKKIQEFGLKREDYWWYLELREYGSVPHAGFGLGFERLVQFATGMENIRDVIPFPRYPGHAEF
ncbi:MAG: asparagine--tRNA ligase [Verrucomicrobia bacterium]|nr:asparagine--tRNA ligase [Verrucomicrobiota bacterium]MDE3048149.1 asparagine--tRNA ligase [Verrucomicrobiota bacterium]